MSTRRTAWHFPTKIWGAVTCESNELEDYEEVIQRFMNAVTPEQRLRGLAPEQRLVGLDPEQIVLALPDAVLHGLSDDYLATLPAPTREAVRKRIGR